MDRQRYSYSLVRSLSLKALLCAVSLHQTAFPSVAEDRSIFKLQRLLGLEHENISFEGFVDGYYAQDFNDPSTNTRDYLTQPSRGEEPNINLGLVGVAWKSESITSRIALQTGSSVDANYAAEPEQNIRYIQEADLAVQLTPQLRVGGGIYPSHIGLESFISRDNWAYTRLLASEFSPYYQTGINFAYDISSKLTVQLHLLNGWQNISDWSGREALGTKVAYRVSDDTTVDYNTFLGKELEGVRFFNDLVFKSKVEAATDLALVFDYGTQERNDDSHDNWFTWAVVGRYSFRPDFRISLRLEQFSDPENVVVSSLGDSPYRVIGTSFGIDYELAPELWWRTEVRSFFSRDPIFRKTRDGELSETDPFLVTALTFSF